jgi:hypothetical protein
VRDFRREVAARGHGVGGLLHRFLGQPLQQLRAHLRVIAPLHELQAFLQHLAQLLRRLQLDPVGDPGLLRPGGR